MAYDVYPSKRIQISLYDHAGNAGILYSGTFVASFTAYEPFGRMLRSSYAGTCTDAELSGTGILDEDMMPAAPGLDSPNCLIYNPGTERAHTVIRLAGDVGDGLLIRNLTSGQRCRITRLKEDSLLPGAWLELDSGMGQTRIVLGGESQLAFAFHDEGYLELAPCMPFVRALRISHTAGSNIVTSDHGFLKPMQGQYLYLNGWRKIREITNANQAILSENAEADGTITTPVVTMNEIELSGDNVKLSKLEIEYTPRVR